MSLSWAKRAQDRPGDEYEMTWTFEGQGEPTLSPPYAQVFALGSSAFALNLIQADVNDEVRGVNVGFLRDPKNLDFVRTPRGPLGQVLAAARATILNPTYVDILPDASTYRIHLRLGFPEGNLPWFARGGFVIVERPIGAAEWKPISLLARRIWAADPNWLAPERADEAEAIQAVRDAVASTRGLVLDTELIRFIELRSRGQYLGPDKVDREAVARNANLLQFILMRTRGRVAPSEIVAFATFGGMLVTSMSDEAFVGMAATMGR